MRAYKVKFPRIGDDPEFQQWRASYESQSRSFNVSRLVDEIGTRQSQNEVIRYHDDLTGVNYRQPLA